MDPPPSQECCSLSSGASSYRDTGPHAGPRILPPVFFLGLTSSTWLFKCFFFQNFLSTNVPFSYYLIQLRLLIEVYIFSTCRGILCGPEIAAGTEFAIFSNAEAPMFRWPSFPFSVAGGELEATSNLELPCRTEMIRPCFECFSVIVSIFKFFGSFEILFDVRGTEI